MNDLFHKIATKISDATGAAGTFIAAVFLIIIWACTGPIFHFSDTWQLVINTSTTIITFLMVFLIQNTQNRDGEATQLKLDELLRATKGASDFYVNLEDLSDKELKELHLRFQKVHERIEKQKTKRGLK